MTTVNADQKGKANDLLVNTEPPQKSEAVPTDQIWSSESKREQPPFLTRMVGSVLQDPLSIYDTYNKLQSIDTHPSGQENVLVDQGRTCRSKRPCLRHITLALSTLLCLFLMVMEIIYMIIGFVYLHKCGFIDIYLIISSFFHLVIIIVEWLRRWIWNLKSHRDSRLRVDLFQCTSAMLLVMCYLFSIVWYAIGLAWIMVPYAESLFKDSNKDEISVMIQSTITVYRQIFCSQTFYNSAIFYQVFILVVFLFRFVMYGFSDFCRGVCYKLVIENREFNNIQTAFMPQDGLHDFLPPISSSRNVAFRGGSQFHDISGLLPRNIHSNLDCMISKIPEWRIAKP